MLYGIRPLRWSVIPANKLESTIWGQCHSPPANVISEEEVESLFSVSPVSSPSKNAANYVAATGVKVRPSLLGLKRNNNISIVLSQFRMSLNELRDALLLNPEVISQIDLSTEQLLALQTLFPLTEDEVKGVQQHVRLYSAKRASADQISLEEATNLVVGEMNKAEQFVWVMSQVPRLSAKLECLVLAHQMDSHLQDIEQDLVVQNTYRDSNYS